MANEMFDISPCRSPCLLGRVQRIGLPVPDLIGRFISDHGVIAVAGTAPDDGLADRCTQCYSRLFVSGFPQCLTNCPPRRASSADLLIGIDRTQHRMCCRCRCGGTRSRSRTLQSIVVVKRPAISASHGEAVVDRQVHHRHRSRCHAGVLKADIRKQRVASRFHSKMKRFQLVNGLSL